MIKLKDKPDVLMRTINMVMGLEKFQKILVFEGIQLELTYMNLIFTVKIVGLN